MVLQRPAITCLACRCKCVCCRRCCFTWAELRSPSMTADWGGAAWASIVGPREKFPTVKPPTDREQNSFFFFLFFSKPNLFSESRQKSPLVSPSGPFRCYSRSWLSLTGNSESGPAVDVTHRREQFTNNVEGRYFWNGMPIEYTKVCCSQFSLADRTM